MRGSRRNIVVGNRPLTNVYRNVSLREKTGLMSVDSLDRTMKPTGENTVWY